MTHYKSSNCVKNRISTKGVDEPLIQASQQRFNRLESSGYEGHVCVRCAVWLRHFMPWCALCLADGGRRGGLDISVIAGRAFLRADG